MKQALITLAWTFLALSVSGCSSTNPFVTVQDGHFVRGGQPYTYIGTNFWYGPILASDGRANHIGLYNVYSRLAICMGKESTLDIERPAEGGTRVIICWRISPTANESAVDEK